MKHIFLINNNMVFLMAMKVIEHDRIAPEDVILLGIRNYTFTESVARKFTTYCPFEFFHTPSFLSLRLMLGMVVCHPRRISALVAASDKTLRGLSHGEQFHFYTPHGIGNEIEAIISMPDCRDYSFLEEGSIAYAKTAEEDSISLSWNLRIQTAIKYLYSKGRLRWSHQRSFPVDDPKFRCFYCAFDDAFRGFPNRCVVGAPFQRVEDLPDDLHAIIVFDGGIVTDRQLRQSVEISCGYAVEKLGHRQIYYKFHPGQNEAVRSEYRKFMSEIAHRHNVDIKELPDKACLENIAMTLGDKLHIFIICSSVGVYAQRCGARVFTTAARYAQGNPRLKLHYEQYGYIFDKYQAI